MNDGRPLRKIAAGLVDRGFMTPAGREYSATAVKRMLGEGGSKSRALKHVDAKGRRLLNSALRPDLLVGPLVGERLTQGDVSVRS
jgi:hypothetical protein